MCWEVISQAAAAPPGFCTLRRLELVQTMVEVIGRQGIVFSGDYFLDNLRSFTSLIVNHDEVISFHKCKYCSITVINKHNPPHKWTHEQNHMIISVDAKEPLWPPPKMILTPFHNKSTRETTNAGKTSQHNNGACKFIVNKHHATWRKTQKHSIKTINKTKMSTLSTTFQHYALNLIESNNSIQVYSIYKGHKCTRSQNIDRILYIKDPEANSYSCYSLSAKWHDTILTNKISSLSIYQWQTLCERNWGNDPVHNNLKNKTTNRKTWKKLNPKS